MVQPAQLNLASTAMSLSPPLPLKAASSKDGLEGVVPERGGCTVTMDEQKDISASFEKVFPWTMFLPAITQGGN